MAKAKDEIKAGELTSEHKMAKNGSLWGTLITVMGVLISGLSMVVENLGDNSKWGIIAGCLVAVAGTIKSTLTELGYTKSRTDQKVEKLKTEG